MIYEITVTFAKGATVVLYATGYRMHFTGHHSNKSGKVFQIDDGWYARGAPRLSTIDVDEIVAVTKREMPRGWTYGG
jgi:hypothetical protein